MTSIDTTSTLIQTQTSTTNAVDPAQLAAAAFLARYSGRTLDSHRHDLRGYFLWAAGVGLGVLEATRPHIELYRAWLEERRLAASTVDQRLSTVCGFYRFAHIDGGSRRTRLSTSADPSFTPRRVAAWTVPNREGSSSPPNAATATTPPWRFARLERPSGLRGVRHQHRGPGRRVTGRKRQGVRPVIATSWSTGSGEVVVTSGPNGAAESGPRNSSAMACL